MKKATAVIGAGWGDEGKGLVVDALASKYGDDGIVVRFNGGAQAGHTVHTPGGDRHVFSHYSAGTFVGATTYLGPHFIVNPLLAMRERLQLREDTPDTIVDAAALITTPYDMMLNHLRQKGRGKDKHGSCGVGINETVTRSQEYGFKLSMSGISRMDDKCLRLFLNTLRTFWVPRRLVDLGIEPKDFDMPDGMIEQWVSDTLAFRDSTDIGFDSFLGYDQERPIIFEGAQGLMLDQTYGAFPFVTRSNCGIQNVIEIAESTGIDELDVIYVTRAYATRHGDGPFLREMIDGAPYQKEQIQETNVTNEYQGRFRLGHLDLDILADAIHYDMDYRGSIKLNVKLAITCLDQMDEDNIAFYSGGRFLLTDLDQFFDEVELKVGAHLMASYGPTRETFYEEEVYSA